jgi:8-oxo-dGTP pyrophosphatase MutT (NUDIX family)
LVPLFQKKGEFYLLLTKRSDQVRYHKGQISFPGGAVKEEDSTLEKVALREAFEEIGLNERDIRIIGLLDDVVAHSSKFIVTPIVALIPYPYPFKVNEEEIAELIEVSFSSLLDKDCFGEKEIFQGNSKEVVHTFQFGEHIIWGATAQILKHFLDLIPSTRESKLPLTLFLSIGQIMFLFRLTC